MSQRTSVGDGMHVGRELRVDRHVRRARERQPVVDDRLHRLVQVERLRSEARHASLGAREMENVLHEMHEAPAFLHDHVGRRASFLLRANASEVERFSKEQNLRQRRAQLVRHARDEIGSQPRQLVLAAQLHDGQRRPSPR